MTHPLDITPDFLRVHAASLRALARSLLSDEGAAEDVLQDTWVTALKRPPGRRDRVSGWLRAVTPMVSASFHPAHFGFCS